MDVCLQIIMEKVRDLFATKFEGNLLHRKVFMKAVN